MNVDLRSIFASLPDALDAALANAQDVDRCARFPTEAISALRKAKLLCFECPKTNTDLANQLIISAQVSYALGARCSSTALIYAMHQTQRAALMMYGTGDRLEALKNRSYDAQLLLASSTTEIESGGDVRRSYCHIKGAGNVLSLEKDASVLSYGEYADIILTTAKRSFESHHGDQVLIALEKEAYTLERTRAWNAMGMRGTESHGYMLGASFSSSNIFDEKYANIHRCIILPVSHILWSSVWLGIAAAMLEKSRLYLEHELREKRNQSDSRLGTLALTQSKHATLRAKLKESLEEYAKKVKEREVTLSIDDIRDFSLLKVGMSTGAVDVGMSCMRLIGMASYLADSKFTIELAFRDLLSSEFMVSNTRIVKDLGSSSILSRDFDSYIF